MRKIFVLFLLAFILQPFAAQAQNNDANSKILDLEQQLRTIEEDIDKVNDEQDSQISNLRNSGAELSRRLQRFNEDYESLQSALSTAATIEKQLAELKASVSNANINANKSSETADSVRWIVAISAVLITGMTAILGLLFSQRFVDLKADARVAQELLTRMEKRVDGVDDTKESLARIEEHIEILSKKKSDES